MSKNRYKLFFSWQSEDTKSRKVLEKSLQDTIKTLGAKVLCLKLIILLSVSLVCPP